QVLRRDDISVTDSFFDLGGDSLGALRMAGRIRQTLDRDLPLQALFAHPKLADLAALLSDQPVFVGGAIRPRPAGMMRLPLSLAQERLWFLWRL
ncbi:phosphopantetheine-binding protein, partial [Acinetobacter baumannii]